MPTTHRYRRSNFKPFWAALILIDEALIASKKALSREATRPLKERDYSTLQASARRLREAIDDQWRALPAGIAAKIAGVYEARHRESVQHELAVLTAMERTRDQILAGDPQAQRAQEEARLQPYREKLALIDVDLKALEQEVREGATGSSLSWSTVVAKAQKLQLDIDRQRLALPPGVSDELTGAYLARRDAAIHQERAAREAWRRAQRAEAERAAEEAKRAAAEAGRPPPTHGEVHHPKLGRVPIWHGESVVEEGEALLAAGLTEAATRHIACMVPQKTAVAILPGEHSASSRRVRRIAKGVHRQRQVPVCRLKRWSCEEGEDQLMARRSTGRRGAKGAQGQRGGVGLTWPAGPPGTARDRGQARPTGQEGAPPGDRVSSRKRAGNPRSG